MKVVRFDYWFGVCFGVGVGILIGKLWPNAELSLFSAVFFFIGMGLLVSKYFFKDRLKKSEE